MCCLKWKYWKRLIWYSLKLGVMNHCWSQIHYWRVLHIAEKEHESSLLKSKERLLVKFQDNTWDWQCFVAMSSTGSFCACKKQSGLPSLLMGYVAIKIVFLSFTVEGWKFRRLDLVAGENLLVMHREGGLFWEGDSIIMYSWCLLPASLITSGWTCVTVPAVQQPLCTAWRQFHSCPWLPDEKEICQQCECRGV